METYYLVALVTLISTIVYAGMAMLVSRAHTLTGLKPPAMTGDPFLERSIRAHSNTMEWMPIFLPSMWLYAIYWSPTWAAFLGCVWIIGRIAYFIGYRKAAEMRLPGFFIQVMAALILVFGALGRVVFLMFKSTG
jgi:glutathione S-transferase